MLFLGLLFGPEDCGSFCLVQSVHMVSYFPFRHKILKASAADFFEDIPRTYQTAQRHITEKINLNLNEAQRNFSLAGP
jgi:hypothetical protein